jgi:hypothetical protein
MLSSSVTLFKIADFKEIPRQNSIFISCFVRLSFMSISSESK